MEEQQNQNKRRRRRNRGNRPWENWGNQDDAQPQPKSQTPQLSNNQLLYRLCVAIEDLCNAIKDTGRVR